MERLFRELDSNRRRYGWVCLAPYQFKIFVTKAEDQEKCSGGSPFREERSISASALASPIGAESVSFGFNMAATLPMRPVIVFDFSASSTSLIRGFQKDDHMRLIVLLVLTR